MSEQNRVTPDGRLVAADVRGAWMGNRGGPLHGRDGSHRIVRTSAGPRWITCVLDFRGRRVEQWVPGHYTPLFFLDEAVALAAGHRPCAECRRADFTAYRAAWAATDPPQTELFRPGGAPAPPGRNNSTAPTAAELDARLRAERGHTHRASWPDLPAGGFVIDDGRLALVLADHLVTWDDRVHGYGDRRPRPAAGTAVVQTPPTTLAALRAGYPMQIDASARP